MCSLDVYSLFRSCLLVTDFNDVVFESDGSEFASADCSGFIKDLIAVSLGLSQDLFELFLRIDFDTDVDIAGVVSVLFGINDFRLGHEFDLGIFIELHDIGVITVFFLVVLGMDGSSEIILKKHSGLFQIFHHQANIADPHSNLLLLLFFFFSQDPS